MGRWKGQGTCRQERRALAFTSAWKKWKSKPGENPYKVGYRHERRESAREQASSKAGEAGE